MNALYALHSLYRSKKIALLPRRKLLGLQEKRLRKILCFAFENSDYYRKTFTECGISDANIGTLPLSAFPTLDKATLLSHFDELITAHDFCQEDLRKFDESEGKSSSEYLGKYHVVHSSGSTGKPSYFVYENRAWNTMLIGIIRAALWDMTMPQIIRFLLRRPHILYVAATGGRYGGVMAVGDGIDKVGAKQLMLDINAPTADWTDTVQSFKPDMIIGYPSAIKILGELSETNHIPIQPSRIVTCGEPLDFGLRTYLEKNFRTKVFNFYGASESLAIGIEADTGGGMFLFDDMNVIEVIDEKMYLTSLYHFTQPLIRYRIDDALTLCEPSEGGLYHFSRADILRGRSEEVLWFEDATGRRDFLHPLAIEGFCVEGLLDYQFVLTAKDAFEISVEITDTGNYETIRDEIIRNMNAILHDRKLDFVRFSVHLTDRINPDPHSGKKKLIINHRNTEEQHEYH